MKCTEIKTRAESSIVSDDRYVELVRQLKEASSTDEICFCMECRCPKCHLEWPEDSKFELCEASKLYKRKGYLKRTCGKCGEVSFTFYVEPDSL